METYTEKLTNFRTVVKTTREYDYLLDLEVALLCEEFKKEFKFKEREYEAACKYVKNYAYVSGNRFKTIINFLLDLVDKELIDTDDFRCEDNWPKIDSLLDECEWPRKDEE